MARVRAADYQSKRAQIKQTATRLFAQKGFHATSINDLAAASGTAKSRLYHYFKSKEQVLYEILSEHGRSLSDDLRGALAPGLLTAEQKLGQYAKTLLARNVASRDEHKLILSELDALPADQRREITILLRQPIKALFDILCDINPGLLVHKKRKFAIAMMFIGMINWAHTWYSDTGDISPERFAALICDSFTTGFSNIDLGDY